MKCHLPLFVVAAAVMGPRVVAAQDEQTVIVTVDGDAVTEGDVQFLMLSRRVPEARRAAMRKRMVDILVEQRVMRSFLKEQKAKASQLELEAQIRRIHTLIKTRGDDPDAVLKRLGLTPARLKEELSLPLMWKSHLQFAVTQQQIREYFQKHKHRYDGTKVKARQIFLKADDDKSRDAAAKELLQIKKQIAAGKISFEDAAKKHSQAPTAKTGGDLGFFGWQGRLPRALSKAAFTMKPDEIGEPIDSPFGVHLMQVTARKPGDISLEDARPVVFNDLSQELWNELVKKRMAAAKIEWADGRKPKSD